MTGESRMGTLGLLRTGAIKTKLQRNFYKRRKEKDVLEGRGYGGARLDVDIGDLEAEY